MKGHSVNDLRMIPFERVRPANNPFTRKVREGGREGRRRGSKCVARAPPIASDVVRSLVRSLSPSSRFHCCRARRRRPPARRYSPFPLAPRNPRGKGEVCFASPTALSNEILLHMSGLARQLHMYHHHVRARPSVYLIVRSGAICTSPLHCRSGDGVGTGWGLGQIEQSTFRRVLRWTGCRSVGRSDERPCPMMVGNPRCRRPTDAQLHLFRKGKTNALYFREPGRH